MDLPLNGIRIVDLSQNLAGPYATQILADLGADVIKVEPPGGDSARAWGPPFWGGESPLFLVGNRNKRSVVFDLRTQGGREALGRLVLGADVFVQALRAGVIEKLGFGVEAVRGLSPAIVYASVTAYGPEGPLSHLPGYDPLMQAHSGLMSITGSPGCPPARVGASVVDLATGMWTAMGVVTALWNREKTGQGSHVVTSLLDTAVALVSYQLVGYLATGRVPTPMGSGIAMVAPYEAFPTADGHLIIAAGNDATFRRLCEALGLDELLGEPRFADNPGRVAHREELRDSIASETRARSTAYLRELLDSHAVPCAPIQDVAAVAEDAQVAASGMLRPASHPAIPDYRDLPLPVRWDGDRADERRPPPLPGEHTEEVLAELGYSKDETLALMRSGGVSSLEPSGTTRSDP